MSLDKIRSWIETSGRFDLTKERSERELAVIDRVARIALDLDGVVAFQGAKAGKGGDQHDLNFARRLPTRKTPVIFCGLLLKPAAGAPWYRRNDIQTEGSVRVYLRTTEAAAGASDWAAKVVNDDGLKSDPEWRYVEIAPADEIGGEELLNLIEDAYYQVGGI